MIVSDVAMVVPAMPTAAVDDVRVTDCRCHRRRIGHDHLLRARTIVWGWARVDNAVVVVELDRRTRRPMDLVGNHLPSQIAMGHAIAGPFGAKLAHQPSPRIAECAVDSNQRSRIDMMTK